MKLELVSFKICPFAQRSIITMRHKGGSIDISYIDLNSPPDWFKEISPFGKVPVLCAENRKYVVFESAVICEFLDEQTPGSLLPEDPLRKAIDRSWIEFGGAVLADFSALIHCREKDKYQPSLDALSNKLQWLENMLGDGPYFNGAELSLVDFAYAPLFMRTEILSLGNQLYSAEQRPKINRWRQQLLALPAVQNSVVDNFRELFIEHIRNKGPYAAEVLHLS
jgi:glutathione S-transferase